jgi:hypothetical protein
MTANYDHPTFITRQMDNLGKTTAGASGTSLITAYPTAVRLHRVAVAVASQGTSAGVAVNVINLSGTTTTTAAAIALSSATATVGYTSVTAGDLNFSIPAGSITYITNGTDATGVSSVTLELTLDPTLASW